MRFVNIFWSASMLTSISTTHIHGHWLDLFITRTACDLIKTVHPSDGLSDHMTVIGDVGVKLTSHPIKKCFSYRCVIKTISAISHGPEISLR